MMRGHWGDSGTTVPVQYKGTGRRAESGEDTMGTSHALLRRTLVVTALAFILVLLFAASAWADSTGARNVGTGASATGVGTVAWTSPGSITADDTSYATCALSNSAQSNYLSGTNYGFSIPAGATINGIQVTIGRDSSSFTSPYIHDTVVSLIKGGVVTGANEAATSTNWPTTITAASYGSTSDLWGTTWTAADINAANFGVALSASSTGTTSRTASVDYMQITVTYTPLDVTPPTVSSIAPASAQTNASSMNFTVTFSEAVNGVDASNFSLTTSGVTGAAVTGVSGSGATRTVAVNTGTGEGTIRLDLSSTTPAITDLAGNPLSATFSSGSVLTVDRTPPTVSSIAISGSTTNPENSSTATFLVTFSESVTGVATSNFGLRLTGVTGSSVTSVSGSGSTRTVTINTGSGDGLIYLDLANTTPAIPDLAGNALTAAFTNFTALVIDKTAPTVTVNQAGGQADPAPSGPVHFTVVFSEPVTGFTTSDVTIGGTAGGTKTATITGSGPTYDVAISGMTSSGTVTASIAASRVTDAAGNNNTASTSTDNSITYIPPGGPNMAGTGASATGVGTVAWTSPGNITADDTSYATCSLASNVQSNYLSGTNYGFSIPAGATINGIQVTIARESSSSSSPYIHDTVVSLIKGGTVTGANRAATTTNWPNSMTAASYGSTSDLWGTTWTAADINAANFGVALSANSSGTGSTRTASVDYMQITVSYTADTTPPTVSSIAPASAQTNASSMNFTVTFSEAVNGVDTGNFSLTTSGVTGAAVTGVSGSGATRTVAVSTGSGDGTIRLDLSSITPAITDLAGNPLSATFSSGGVLTVDKTPPQITAPDANALATGLTTPVTLAATATDAIDPSVAVTYWIGSTQIFSGHAFPLGPTVVTAKASDAAGNAATPVDFTVTVNKRAITVTAVTASKTYDGDTSSSTLPIVGGDGLAPGDAATYVQAYDTKDVGTGKTITPVVTITSGGVGDRRHVAGLL